MEQDAPIKPAPVARVPIRSWAWHAGLTGLSLVLLVLSFAPVGWGWLAHVALAPLLVLSTRSDRPWRLLAVTFPGAWLWWLWMIHWLDPVTRGGYIAVAALLACYVPAALFTVRLIDRAWRWPMTLVFPIVWVAFEVIRGWFLAGGWGWFTLAHSQAPFDPEHAASRLIQVADLFGEPAVSLLVAMTNGLLVDVLTRPWVVPLPDGRSLIYGGNRASVIVWMLLLGGSYLYGEWRIGQTDAVVEPGPVVGVVQTNVPQNHKDSPTSAQAARQWQAMIDMSRQAAAHQLRPDLIVWPETMVPASLNDDAIEFYRTTTSGAAGSQVFHEQISQLAQQLHVNLLVGAPASSNWKPVKIDDGYYLLPTLRYNSAFLFTREGRRWLDRYDKMHRVPFGEYIPWVEDWPRMKELFMQYFSPYEYDYTLQKGKQLTRFPLNSVRAEGEGSNEPLQLATPICFEDTVGRLVRTMVYENGRKRVDLLVNLTNDGWFMDTGEPWQHLQIAVLRCVENRVPMARSVNTGVSGMIDSAGRVGPLVEVEGRRQSVAGVAVAQLHIDPRSTLYGRLGQWPAVAVIAAMFMLLLASAFRRVRMGLA